MEISDVVSLEKILAEWGNDIRDRTVQRYASNAERNTADPNPEPGQISYVANRGALEYYHGGTWRGQIPPGTIIDHAGGTTPVGYLICDGQAVSRSTFSALFDQIGTIWGPGDGSTTFNVPDLRGRVTRGVATSGTGASVGDTFGSDTHTHTTPNTNSAGSHTHTQGNTGSAGGHSHSLSSGFAMISFFGHALQFRRKTTANWTMTHSTPGGDTTTYPTPGEVSAIHNRGMDLGGNTGSVSNHSHSTPNTNSAGGHSHTIGNTGSTSTIQRGAAVIKLIKT